MDNVISTVRAWWETLPDSVAVPALMAVTVLAAVLTFYTALRLGAALSGRRR